MKPLLQRVHAASAPSFAPRFHAQINALTSNAKLADRPRKVIVEGPQGTGKSTLLNAIVGHPVFPGTDLKTSLSVTLEVSFANPIHIPPRLSCNSHCLFCSILMQSMVS
jgi:ABC-type thiamine transport system ATPase subunit